VTQELALVALLYAFYLYECVLWLPLQTQTFCWRVGGRFAPRTPAVIIPVSPLGAVLASLMPGYARTFATATWPVSLSPQSVNNLDPYGAADTLALAPREILFADRPTFYARGTTLYAGQSAFCKCHTPDAARDLLAFLRQLAAADEVTREDLLAARIAARFDGPAIRERLAAVRTATRNLTTAGLLTFLMLFVFVPAALLDSHARPLLWPAVTVAALNAILIAWAFMRAAKDLNVHKAGRIVHATEVALLPFLSPRAAERLALHAMLGFEPVAVALELCKPAVANEVAATALRRLSHPLPPLEGANIEPMRQRLLAALRTALQARNIDEAKLLAAPNAIGADAHSHCPRCLMQYRQPPDGTTPCPHCKSVTLLPLASV